jgi:hypothetical protein
MVLVTSAWLGRCSQQVPQSFNVVYMYFYNIYIYIYIYIYVYQVGRYGVDYTSHVYIMM